MSYASWGAYIASSVLLVGVLSPTLSGVATYASDSAAVTVAEGLSQVFNELSSGVVATFGYHPTAGNVTVRIGDNLVVVSSGSQQVWRVCRWTLPVMSILPDRLYSLRVVGGSVEVTQDV